MANEIEVPISLDDAKLNRDLRNVERGFTRFGSTLQSTFDKGSASFEVFKGTLAGNIAFKGLELTARAVGAAFGFMVNTFSEAITEAANQEVAINNLNQSLARAGILTPQVSQSLLAFSTALQASSTFTDDQAQASLALLASLTRLDAEGLKGATQAAANLATVLGIDLDSATRLVAKAANGNITAFQRYGIEIRAGANDAETFANTLKVLNERFGGAAQGQLRTFSGSLVALKNAYSDLLEPIGDVIVKNPVVVGLFNALKNALVQATEALSNNGAAIGFIGDAILASLSVFEQLVRTVDGVGRIFAATWNAIQIVVTGATIVVVDTFNILINSLLELGKQLPVVGELFAKVTNPLNDLSAGLKQLASEDVQQFNDAFTKSSALTDFADQIAKVRQETTAFAAQSAVAAPGANGTGRVGGEQEENNQILAARQQLNIDLQALETENALAVQEANLAKRTFQGIEREQDLIEQQSFEQAKLELQFTAEEQKAQLIIDSSQRQLALEKVAQQRSLAQTRLNSQQEVAQLKFQTEQKRQELNTQLGIASNFLNAGLALAKDGSAAQKALQTTQAIVNTYTAATNALADTRPSFLAPAAAASIIALGLANVARINGAKFAQGGIVGGNSFAGDRVPARVNSGEMILNRQQQAELFSVANGNSSGGGSADMVRQIVNEVKSIPIVVVANGREIARLIRDEKAAGFIL